MDTQRHHPSFKLFASILLSLLLVGLIAATLNFARRLPGMASGQSHPPSPTPDCRVINPDVAISGTDAFTSMAGVIDSLMPCTTSRRVRRSHIIAEVVVTAVGPVHFETSDGRPPTASPSETVTLTDLDNWEYRMQREVVLDVRRVFSATTFYSSPEVAGYVVDAKGGTYPPCRFEYFVDPERWEGEVGTTGMVFLYSHPDLFTDPPTWFAHLIQTAETWSRPGRIYRPAKLYIWYRYEPTTGLAYSPDCPPIPISQLVAEVEAATGR